MREALVCRLSSGVIVDTIVTDRLFWLLCFCTVGIRKAGDSSSTFYPFSLQIMIVPNGQRSCTSGHHAFTVHRKHFLLLFFFLVFYTHIYIFCRKKGKESMVMLLVCVTSTFFFTNLKKLQVELLVFSWYFVVLHGSPQVEDDSVFVVSVGRVYILHLSLCSVSPPLVLGSLSSALRLCFCGGFGGSFSLLENRHVKQTLKFFYIEKKKLQTKSSNIKSEI